MLVVLLEPGALVFLALSFDLVVEPGALIFLHGGYVSEVSFLVLLVALGCGHKLYQLLYALGCGQELSLY